MRAANERVHERKVTTKTYYSRQSMGAATESIKEKDSRFTCIPGTLCLR